MSEMFKNYPQPADYIPNNRPQSIIAEKITIMTGETSEHSFELPFNVHRECLNLEVIYKLGLEDIIVRELSDLEVEITKDDTTMIICKLSPAETNLFRNTFLDANLQLKLYLVDGSVAFSDVYKIYVTNSLDTGETPPPSPGVLGGLGYTED